MADPQFAATISGYISGIGIPVVSLVVGRLLATIGEIKRELRDVAIKASIVTAEAQPLKENVTELTKAVNELKIQTAVIASKLASTP